MRLAAASICAVILRYLCGLLAIAALVHLPAPPVAAQPTEINAALKHFKQLLADEDYDSALVQGQSIEAMVKARYGINHANYGIALHNLALVHSMQGQAYWNQGKYAEAAEAFRRALAINERAPGANNLDLAAGLDRLAAVYREQSRTVEAIELEERALAIKEKARGKDHPDLAITLNNLGLMYEDQARYAEAEQLFKRVIAIKEKLRNKDNPDLADTLDNLAFVYAHQTRYEEAEALHKRALAINEKALGKDHPSVAVSLLVWPAYMVCRASTQRPKVFTSARLPSARRCSHQTTPWWHGRSENLPLLTCDRGNIRRLRTATGAR